MYSRVNIVHKYNHGHAYKNKRNANIQMVQSKQTGSVLVFDILCQLRQTIHFDIDHVRHVRFNFYFIKGVLQAKAVFMSLWLSRI